MSGHRPIPSRQRQPVPDCSCSECRKRERYHRYDIHTTTHRGSSTVTREIVAGGIVLALILAGLGLLVPVLVFALVLGTIYMIVKLQSKRSDERVRAGLDASPPVDDVIREAHVLPDGRCSYCYALASVHVGGDGRLQDVSDFHGFANPRRTGGPNATGAIQLGVTMPCSRCGKIVDRIHLVRQEIVCTTCVTRSDLS